MRVLVLGLGISGKAVCRYLVKRGESLVAVDRKPDEIFQTELPQVRFLLETASPQLETIDLIIKSPGIAKSHPWVRAAEQRQIPIQSEIDLALAALKNGTKRLLGITGSNGKTTTTLLTTHLLNISGHRAVAVGNVGVPLISQIESPAETLVIELSSFQLEDLQLFSVLDGAVILNITQNHLDRHLSFDSYQEAKWQIARCLKVEAPLYLGPEVKPAPQWAHRSRSLQDQIHALRALLSQSKKPISLYRHDLENAAAAYALTQVSESALREGLASFQRPPHRLEPIGYVDQVAYINDSKATSVDAVIKALEALEGPLILIAGGVDKGGSFRQWLPYLTHKVVRVIALGAAANRIAQELTFSTFPLPVEKVATLKEALLLAQHHASAGMQVLLSPGCSSYDLYKNYEARGDHFRELVLNLNSYKHL